MSHSLALAATGKIFNPPLARSQLRRMEWILAEVRNVVGALAGRPQPHQWIQPSSVPILSILFILSKKSPHFPFIAAKCFITAARIAALAAGVFV